MKKIEILHGWKVGAIDAANDSLLLDCFQFHPAYQDMKDENDQKTFIYGRTGTGKTAIIKKLESEQACANTLDLTIMGLDYVTNSDIINFLNAFDVNLDIFFQTLWKHVLIIEYIKARFKANDVKKSRTIFQSLTEAFGQDESKKSALEYLEKYADKFWVDTDKIVSDITETLKKGVEFGLSAEMAKFKADANYVNSLDKQTKTQIKSRAKQFVNSNLLSELNRVMRLLREYRRDKLKDSIYILIDKIDENWVDEAVRYQLIHALIDSQQSFGKIRDLRIIIAIRADILERVLQYSADPGSQREKYDDVMTKLIWSESQLKQLIDKRISHLCKRQYTKGAVYFDDIFTSNIGTIKPFKYLIERTHNRPRDIISFVNEALGKSVGKHEVTASAVREAEGIYSTIRLDALKDEWKSALPSLPALFKLISSRKTRFKVSNLCDAKTAEELVLELADLIDKESKDPIAEYMRQNFDNWSEDNLQELRKLIVTELYRVGAVGVKLSSAHRTYYSYLDSPIMKTSELDHEASVSVHKSLHRVLNISDKGISTKIRQL